ncbi:MAG TPA: MmcQ/YjbR family DNA-binding protein [Bryobacteraceae bacterium]|nr:MmcQ/YjbR family DNA-binding protein [Bryobacteraceae bacterium]
MSATFDTVREIALSFPEVEEGTTYGAPAFKVGGQFFTSLASHKLAEPGTLVVRMDFEHRDELISADPDVYYLQDHYQGYPCVLVRLSRVHPEALRDLLGGARRFVMAQKAKRGRTPAKSKRKRAQ